MKFYPDSIEPEYRAESDVWDIVREALKDENGVAWHGYRLYREGRSYSYAPDIFILSRRYGAIVIECKGCQIDQISAIYNTVWQMDDWYKQEITPVSQVENQKFEIQNLLKKKKIPHPERLRFRVMVALPFVTSVQWTDSGFANEEATKPVALAENLTVEGFLAWLDQRQDENPQPYLTDTEWTTIVGALGGRERAEPGSIETIKAQDTATTKPYPPKQEQVVFLIYEGDPLHDDAIRKHLELPYLNAWKGTESMPDYWYLVPTAGLERQRRNLAPNIQIQEPPLRRHANSRQNFDLKLLFRKALVHLMSLGPKPRIATRVSELVHLRRAMQSLEKVSDRREQLQRDWYAWVEAFRKIEERDFDLTGNTLEYEQLFVHPDVATLMGEMQVGFHHELASQDEVTFEAAARAFLHSKDFQPPPLVVMEGFTRLTPLQEEFVKCCLSTPECTIWFILPSRDAQAEGFEAIKNTYHELLKPTSRVVRESLRRLREPTELVALQRSLFSDEAVQGEQAPESVVIEAYATRQREVAACVRHLKNYLDANPKHQIAVVTRDPLKYRTLLREEAVLLDASFAESFDIPPMHLLLTPVGRFVLSLYASWQHGRLTLNAEQFRSILASGWLGRRAKNSVPLFQSIEPAFFARCEDGASWQRAFSALEDAMRERVRGRTLAAWCTPDDAALWRKTMDIVISLARQLFDGQRYSLSRQIERLQSTLETLDLQDVQEDERDIIQRILAALQSFVDLSDLELDGEEVGDVLNSLIRQREDTENHERITVTGPESLDGLQKDVVYYLGVDEHRVPRAPGDNWPLAEINISENQIQERYLFFAVVRAATKRLYLTYAEIDDHQACGPSLYLDEVVRTLKRGQVPFADRPTVEDQERPEATTALIGPVQRDVYAVSELAQFQVCPLRYHLQRMTHTANYYREAWQVQFLIQGMLLKYVLTAFQAKNSSAVPEEEFFDKLTVSLDTAIVRAKKIFTGYTEADWFFIIQPVKNNILDLSNWTKQNWTGQTVRVETRQDIVAPLRSDNGRTINIQAAVRFVIYGVGEGQAWRNVYITDLLAEEWLLPSAHDTTPNSRYLATQWWRQLTQDLVKNAKWVQIGEPIRINNGKQELPSIEEIMTQVERGEYQARPGNHCSFCPVKGLCLGKQTGGSL